ncbi:DUF6084 family protein [Mycolicibacterium diernhoferi]|uniref:Uncharacterized protein n=1 Tax=Mycolicibacterium diernhoferi TaxID=1801 RepID=A0A1Q4HB03_9MYCO|nr:DUF6084 family protein [Mycolicibacterium diernhoferi]OJZ64612.1 hypothetical protein BRW64_16990 [Mycolicibacterium diernhoferi]OPE46884.1 hypothetical protein BV510_25715 [Mycolicibacterium diernhoferi]PEG51222.1 hypothetical protein CRI78_27685 [Mycolicibacterium diernhoferi]QYL24935.1 hypothetical protein K0O62_12155 [Mycolicibacterium diernhoferi]
MTELGFTVEGIAPEPYAATPVLMARIGISADGPEPIHAVALRAQVRIDPLRRSYTDDEGAGLVDLFGRRERWSTSQHTFLWQHTSTVVPGFTGDTVVELPLVCTYDFEVKAAKYLLALDAGTVPLQFLFSGTVFTQGAAGFSVQQVPWDRDADFDMPVAVWRDLVRLHYPAAGWLRLTRDTLDALATFRSARGLLGFDDAITELLCEARELR